MSKNSTKKNNKIVEEIKKPIVEEEEIENKICPLCNENKEIEHFLIESRQCYDCRYNQQKERMNKCKNKDDNENQELLHKCENFLSSNAVLNKKDKLKLAKFLSKNDLLF